MGRKDSLLIALLLIATVAWGYGILIQNKDLVLQNAGIYDISGDLNLWDNVQVNGYLQASGNLISGNNVTAFNAFCLNSDCITSWSQAGSVFGSGASGQVAFWTSGDTLSSSSNLYWDNVNGYLGIGTFSPSARLHVVSNNIKLEGTNPSGSASPQIQFRESGRTQYWILTKRGSSYTSQPDWLLFSYYDGASWNPVLYMLPTSVAYFPGSVGIGTSSPSTKLHLVGNAKMELSNSQTINIDSTVSSDVTNYGILDVGMVNTGGSTNTKALLRLALESASTHDITAAIRIVDNSASANIIYGIYAPAGTKNYFGGSVGIGTSSPGSKLDVAGEIKGTKFTDRDNTSYYVDPSNTGTSVNVAGTASVNDLQIRNRTSCGKLYTDASGNVLCGTDQTGITSESDPQVGATTNGYVCYGTGSQVTCADSAFTYSTSSDKLTVKYLRVSGRTSCGKLYTDASGNVLCGTDQGGISDLVIETEKITYDGGTQTITASCPSGYIIKEALVGSGSYYCGSYCSNCDGDSRAKARANAMYNMAPYASCRGLTSCTYTGPNGGTSPCYSVAVVMWLFCAK